MLDQVVQINTSTFKYTLESKLKKSDPAIIVDSAWQEFTANVSSLKEKRRKYVITLNSPKLSKITGYEKDPVRMEFFLEEDNFSAIQTLSFGGKKESQDLKGIMKDLINAKDISLRLLQKDKEEFCVSRIQYQEEALKVLTKSKFIPNIETLYHWGSALHPFL